MRRTLVVIIVAVLGILLPAGAASATYYITGWQTNSGWNSLDGCSIYRKFNNGTYPQNYSSVAADDFLCNRDVGVRGKGINGSGTSFEYTNIVWDNTYAKQSRALPSIFNNMKVYHGDH